MRVTVIGGGSWGTAFSVVLREHGHDVTLACRSEEQALEIMATGRNPRYLSHVDLTGVVATTIEQAPVAEANLAVVAVPSAAFGATVAALPGTCPVLSLTKGLDPATGNRLSTLVKDRPVAVLSGPNIADEISRGLPAAAVIAGEDSALSVQLQLAITSPTFRVYVNDDVVGVELCAAAKNVIALAAGGADGLGLGDNAKAALVARGLAEMGRFAEAAGARPETFAGLAGHGRPDRHVLVEVRAQPPLRRARRPGGDAGGGGGRDRHGRRGPDDRTRAARPLAPARGRDADHRRCLHRARRRAARRPRGDADAARSDVRVAASPGYLLALRIPFRP